MQMLPGVPPAQILSALAGAHLPQPPQGPGPGLCPSVAAASGGPFSAAATELSHKPRAGLPEAPLFLYFSGSPGHPAWRPAPWEQKQPKAWGLWGEGAGASRSPLRRVLGQAAAVPSSQDANLAFVQENSDTGSRGPPASVGRPLQVAGKAVSKPQGGSWAAGSQQGARLVTGPPSPPGSPSVAASG